MEYVCQLLNVTHHVLIVLIQTCNALEGYLEEGYIVEGYIVEGYIKVYT